MPRKRTPHTPSIPAAWADGARQNDPAVYQFNTRTAENGAQVPGRERTIHVRTIVGVTADDERISNRLAEAWEARQRSPSKDGVFVDSAPDWGAIALRQTEAEFEWAEIWGAVPRWAKVEVGHVCAHNRALAKLPNPEEAGRKIIAALRVMAKEGW